ncbi:TraI/MobA(P) family conjugative relaxase [Morganella psychrotolerans]|uniref:TraI/MobA(P) family conjugative relaxase n=1 Tax=Morganella psychrotolerans TaxID=368603 RepID=UPI0039AF957B
MIIIIPPKRQDGDTSFRKLVEYISVRDGLNNNPDDIIKDAPNSVSSDIEVQEFNRLTDYIDRSESYPDITVTEQFYDGRTRAKCGIVESETNCFTLDSAAAEMNIVAAQSIRCKQPVYHFILSWQESEKPSSDDVFNSAKYCIEQLGMADHQYVTSIHTDTDNLHCHIALNRVNPETYLAQSIWNDADILQKCCRELEEKYGFNPDNGSWVRNNDGMLVRAPFRFSGAPQGAAKREIFSDKESLYHYAVRNVRTDLTTAFQNNQCSWEMLHRILNEKGLVLRERGAGLVIGDAQHPDSLLVKASDIHSTLTKFRLESYLGQYQPAPEFSNLTDPDPENWFISSVNNTYNPEYQVRDRDSRAEQRQVRAEARDALKIRYKDYKAGWVKPDLNVKERFKRIASHCRVQKDYVRGQYPDVLMRKLLYRVAEFEKMKSISALRLTVRKEQNELIKAGHFKPLTYRGWCEQEALAGDKAALSQLRGWHYREKRKDKTGNVATEGIRIRYDDFPVDTAVIDTGTHSRQLKRDGTVVYLRNGLTAVVDSAEGININAGFEDYSDDASCQLATKIISSSEVKQIVVSGSQDSVNKLDAALCSANMVSSEQVSNEKAHTLTKVEISDSDCNTRKYQYLVKSKR